MPQVKEPLLRTLIKEVLKEAELSIGEDNTNFKIKVDVSNPQSETKLGIRIQLEPTSEEFLFTDTDKKDKVSVAIMKKLNSSLGQYDIQVSKDTDVPDPTVLGFFIPLPQIKNMIVSALQGGNKPTNNNEPPSTPRPPLPDLNKGTPEDEEDEEALKEIIRSQLNEMRVRDLNEISKVVVKEDFYNFINAGNNVLRTLEENGISRGKKYLGYLVKHNIM
tara:strand:+ start:506 stop:1162 length:657 start_codon:yes stop_codon:yes gene_type:complete